MKRTNSMKYTPSFEARELTLYAENTATLYRSRIVPVVNNLARYYSKGTFDKEKAVDAFYPVACDAARMYCREFARVEDAPSVFSVTDRFTAAVDLLDGFMEDIENGGL